MVAFDDFRLELKGGSTLTIEEFLARAYNDALVVLRDGRIVFEAYANGMSTASTHILMSASKSVLGLLCGILADRGALDLGAEIGSVLPETAGTVYGRATPRELLDMRIAPRFDEATRRAYEAASGWEPAPPGQELTGLHDFFASLPPTSEPHGGPFAYVSANTDLLGWVIERSTGSTVAALLGELLWSPMAAVSPAGITLDRNGAPRCTGGVCATAHDFARLGQLVADDGVCGATNVIPASWIADIAEHGDRNAWTRGEFAQAFSWRRMHYRSGWYVIDDAPKTLFAMGVHGQNLFVDPGNRLVVAMLSSQPEPIDASLIGLTHLAVAEIRRVLLT